MSDRPDPAAATAVPSTSAGNDGALAPLASAVPPPAILGNYRVGALLGRGGMAAVYRAEQLSLGRVVALKVIAPPHTADPGFCDRFLREARLAAQVNHPNVITVFDAGQQDGFLYMALELIGGGDAGKAITADGGRLDEARALRVAADVCRGLIALEHGGLVHRDIKPANIFLLRGADGERAKLADLGLARSSAADARMTATGAAMGTPAYMSPEQAEGRADVDIRTDLYALGGTLYALLTGEPPYRGSSAWTVMAQVLKDPVPDPRQTQPAISNASASIVIHCLQKTPTSRYQTPRQLLDDLEAAAAGRVLVHARLIAHPSASWQPLAAGGPLGRHVTREHSTIDVPVTAPRADQPRDDLGRESPAHSRRRWWLLGGLAASAVVVAVAAFASRDAPPAPVIDRTRTIEADLATLQKEDPLRPRPTPLNDHDEPPLAPVTVLVSPPPAAVVVAPTRREPVPAPADPVALTPVVTVLPPPPPQPESQPEVPVAVAAPAPVTVAAPPATPEPPRVVVEIDAPTASEAPAEIDAPAEIPAEAEPATRRPDPVIVATAVAKARQAALERTGFRCRIEVLPNGNWAVTVLERDQITDLGPLTGLPIERLDIERCVRLTGDLASLTGMPLRELRAAGCTQVTSLRGLRGAPLERLTLSGCERLTPDLSQLAGTRITHLDLSGCRALTSLTGLEALPLVELNLTGCDHVTRLDALAGCPLVVLIANDCSRLGGDLRGLTEAPLQRLELRGAAGVTALTGLTAKHLTQIDLSGCTQLTSVAPLRGAQITRLDLSSCRALTSFDGLQGMALRDLNLRECRSLTGDFTLLRGAPLEQIDASYCSSLSSLNGLQQAPLRRIVLTRNTGITDYTPLAGIRDVEIVR